METVTNIEALRSDFHVMSVCWIVCLGSGVMEC